MSFPKTRPDLDDEAGPSASDLALIEAEWPLIEAQMTVVDAEIAILTAGWRGATDLDWRRLRRAERQVLRVAVQLAATYPSAPTRRPAGKAA